MKKLIWVVMTGLVLCFGISLVRGEEFSCELDEKNIVFQSAGATFVVSRTSPYHWLSEINGAKIGVVTTVNINGPKHFGASHFRDARLIVDELERKVVTITGYAYDIKTKEVIERYLLDLTLEIKKGFPCLFTEAKLINTGPGKAKANFVSYLRWAMESYAIEKMETSPVLASWRSMGKGKWVYLKNELLSIGIIADGKFDSSPGRQIYFNHFAELMEEGEIIEKKAIFLPAKSPDEVSSIYNKIK